MAPLGNNVAVIGSGVFGLLAIKNLEEQGLQVTAFERHDYVGGLWHPTTDKTQVSALATTHKQTSQQCSCFSDFPYPKGTEIHPSAAKVDSYINSYADHFGLRKNIRFSTLVTKVQRDDANGKWIVYTKSAKAGPEVAAQPQSFDRVVVATGQLGKAHPPKYKGAEKFTGDLLHSSEFKNPEKYAGKRVIIVGASASAADAQTILVKSGVTKVYLSHRGQFFLLPRKIKGKAFEHSMTARSMMFSRALMTYCPNFMLNTMMPNMLIKLRKTAYPSLNDFPGFSKPRLVGNFLDRPPMFADDLEKHVQMGLLESVFGIEEITGPSSVRCTDGTVLEDIAAIIMCSGAGFDFSLLKGSDGDPVDPAAAPDGYSRIRSQKFYEEDNPFPRLYQGFLSEKYPESLAFLGHLIIMAPPFALTDLITMAIGGLWSGSYPIAPLAARTKDINAQYDAVVSRLAIGPLTHSGLRWANGTPTLNWLHDAAGTGVNERIGSWSLEGWKFWWYNRELYNTIMNSPVSPHMNRLFDIGRGRKAWSGAAQAIRDMSLEVKQLGEKWEEEEKNKKKV